MKGPYECDVCVVKGPYERFKQDSSSKKHIRIHTGERPYLCDMLSKQFTSSSALKQHPRVYTGESVTNVKYVESNSNKIQD